MGDHMEIELFKVSRAQLVKLEDGDYHAKSFANKDLKILKRYDFSSET